MKPQLRPGGFVLVTNDQGKLVIVSMSGRKRTRFLIRCLPATTVQTCEHGDRQPGVQVHCPFR